MKTTVSRPVVVVSSTVSGRGRGGAPGESVGAWVYFERFRFRERERARGRQTRVPRELSQLHNDPRVAAVALAVVVALCARTTRVRLRNSRENGPAIEGEATKNQGSHTAAWNWITAYFRPRNREEERPACANTAESRPESSGVENAKQRANATLFFLGCGSAM